MKQTRKKRELASKDNHQLACFDEIFKRYEGKTYFACEDLDLSFNPETEVKPIVERFEEIRKVNPNPHEASKVLGEEFKRDPDEIFVLLISLARDKRIIREITDKRSNRMPGFRNKVS